MVFTPILVTVMYTALLMVAIHVICKHYATIFRVILYVYCMLQFVMIMMLMDTGISSRVISLCIVDVI